MQMKKDEIVNELLRSANENGLIVTLCEAFGKSVFVRVPFSKKSCNTSIDELDFSARAHNSLKRAGVFSIGEAIDLIEGEGLIRVRNLGKKTQNEIKTLILSFGYAQLNENEKRRFFFFCKIFDFGVFSYGKTSTKKPFVVFTFFI